MFCNSKDHALMNHIIQEMETDIQGQHHGWSGQSLSKDHADLVGSDADRERLRAARSTSLPPSSPALKKVAGPGTWTTPTSVLVEGFTSPWRKR
jgi:hypothetical protein